MATIDSTQLRKGVVFKDKGRFYIVQTYKHVKKGRGLATIRVKVLDIESGAKIEKTFTSNEKVEAADLSRQSAQYLYSDAESSYFMNSNDYSQVGISNEVLGGKKNFLTEGEKVSILHLEDKPIGMDLPKKVKLKVIDAEAGIAGDTAGTATKKARLETDFSLQVPLFIKKGDVIIVNTDNGNYVSKA